MKKSILFLSSVLLSFSALSHSPTQHSNQDTQTNDIVLKNSLQKEIWSTVLFDVFEMQQEELKEGIIFKENEKHNISKYQTILIDICVEEKLNTCPEAFFTTKKNIPVAAMYPNGKMYLNIDVVDKLTMEELTYSISHEMGHFIYQHSLKNSFQVAESLIENSFIVTDPEKWARASGILPGMRQFHHKIEDEADQYAISYLKKKGININCQKMFQKMTGDSVVSTDQHGSPNERCKKFDQSFANN